MTYQYTDYEFTAFSISDLRPAGESQLDCGETFEMPSTASLCITVNDNDAFLSGDCYDQANDHYGQQASIEGPSGELGNGGQIYAETYLWVQDQNHNWFLMIEIEQEGTHEKYYTFHNGYGIPDDGAQLTVHQQCNVSGNWVDYKCLDAGDKIPSGTISGTVFCDTDCDGLDQQVEIVAGKDYTIEAEDMWEYGFQTVHGANASGGQLVKLNCTGGDGELCTTFNGHDGVYDVKIRVQDENDGQSMLKLKVNGHIVEAIRLDGDTDGAGSNNGGFSTYVIQDVSIDHGDDISIAAWGDHGEWVRIDKIDLEGEDTTVVTKEPTKEGVTVKLLNADGSAALDADGNAITTVTDADGNYSFDGVPVGDYKVMGVAPDGTEFTIQDAGSDDSIDSDVDASGTSGVISVTDGSNTDVDLGLKDIEEGTITGTVFCDVDCDGIQDSETTLTKGDGIFTDSVTFESVDCTTANVHSYGSWYSVGADVIDLVVGDEQGHSGNAHDNTLVELDKGGIWCRQFEVAESGTYCLTLDVYKNDRIPEGDNKFTVKINGADVAVETVNADGTVEISIEMEAGHNRIDFVSNSTVHYLGVGIDNIQIAPLVEETVSTEPAKEGVTVKLLDATTGAVVAETMTDADGTYEFANVRAGDYKVMGVAPDGTEFTIQDAGNDDSIDSDVDANGMSGVITVTDESVTDVDLGVKEIKTGSLSGRYFCDDDGDGLESAGDSPIGGATVILLDAAGNEAARTTTENDGTYVFNDVDAGDYTVLFQAPDTISGQVGKEFVAPNQGNDEAVDSDVETADANGGTTGTVTVVAGAETQDVDAGIADPKTSVIAGSVFCDENDDDLDNDGAPVGGVTVNLLNADGSATGQSTTTANDGTYSFAGLAAGSYIVEFDETTAGGKVLVGKDANGNGNDDIDSDADQGTGRTDPITVGVADTVSDIDAGVEDPGTASVGDTVFVDANGNGVRDGGEVGLDGVDVTLTGAGADGAFGTGDDTSETVTTAGGGQYAFNNLDAGDYKVTFDEATAGGLVFTTEGADADDATNDDSDAGVGGMTDVFTLDIAETETDIDAGLTDPKTSVIAGSVFCDENDDDLDNDGAPVGGVTVNLLNADGSATGQSTTTANDGTYSFAGLAAGSYIVEFDETTAGGKVLVGKDANGNGNDDIDSDADQGTGRTDPITVGVADTVSDIDAGVEDPGTASVGDTVFVDANGNGVRDGGEVGLDGVDVTLTGAGADGAFGTGDDTSETVTTAGGGQYAFNNLDAGDYKVTFDEATAGGLVFTTEGADADDATNDDSDAGVGGMTDVFTLDIAETETDIDAGLTDPKTSVIAGSVFCDENDDDLDNDGAPVGGVTVNLLNADGSATGQSTTTANDGTYSFAGLAAGSYIVEFDETTAGGKVLVGKDANGNGNDDIDSDADQGTGRTDPITVGVADTVSDIDAGVEDPGDASIGDKVWIDLNGDGIQGGDEPGLDGVVVNLLNADGNIVGTQTTMNGGRYLFQNLDAGTYSVIFQQTDGFGFTLQDQTNDAFDSDADQITGVTADIILGVSEANLTVDAGVVSDDPNAVDDSAMTCADETVTVDVLANDTDDEPLTITQVAGQAISEGGPAVDVNGVLVSLVGGELVFDGVAEFATLEIRQEAFRTIEYGVSDGLGGFDTADVDLKFCGALNTLETISNSLPTQGQFLVQQVTVGNFIDAYTLEISGTGDTRLDGLVIEEAYCMDYLQAIGTNILTTATISLATEANGITAGVPLPENIDLVNWLINQDFGSMDNGDGLGDTYTDLEVQEAIWTLLNGDTFTINNPAVNVVNDDEDGVREAGELATFENVAEIVAMVNASTEAEGFEAGAGDLVGLLFDPFDPASQDQPFIVAVSFDHLSEDCVCI